MYVQPENFVFVSSVGIKRVDCICAAPNFAFLLSVGIKRVVCVCAAREFCLCIECRYKEG